jgi:hypothetical protein
MREIGWRKDLDRRQTAFAKSSGFWLLASGFWLLASGFWLLNLVSSKT